MLKNYTKYKNIFKICTQKSLKNVVRRIDSITDLELLRWRGECSSSRGTRCPSRCSRPG